MREIRGVALGILPTIEIRVQVVLVLITERTEESGLSHLFNNL